jgi:hypothetical protein
MDGGIGVVIFILGATCVVSEVDPDLSLQPKLVVTAKTMLKTSEKSIPTPSEKISVPKSIATTEGTDLIGRDISFHHMIEEPKRFGTSDSGLVQGYFCLACPQPPRTPMARLSSRGAQYRARLMRTPIPEDVFPWV